MTEEDVQLKIKRMKVVNVNVTAGNSHVSED
jgi:hypothetical protein